MDPSKITLTNLYTDANENLTNADVYANGVMQALLFPAVNYDGTASTEDIAAIKDYVYNNVVIWKLNSDGSSSELTWTKLKESNGFLHDLNRGGAAGELMGKAGTNDIRTPIYFTVPVGSVGEYRLFARLDGNETSKVAPVTVMSRAFNINVSDFEITKVASATNVDLRVLKTKGDLTSLPLAYKLTTTDLKGIQYKYGSTWSGADQVMMASKPGHKAGFFLRHDALGKTAPVYTMGEGYYYPSSTYKMDAITDSDLAGNNFFPNEGEEITQLEASHSGWGYPESFSQTQLDSAFSLGLPMLMVSSDSIYMTYLTNFFYPTGGVDLDFFLRGFTVRDNFGNVMVIDINWDVSDWYGTWAVSNVGIVYSS